MFPGLVRILAWLNLLLAVIATALLVPLLQAVETDTTEPVGVMAAFLGFYLLLLLSSGIGLAMRRRWGKWIAFTLATLLLAEGVWHSIRAEWEFALFCASYVVLAGLLLLNPGHTRYFKTGAPP